MNSTRFPLLCSVHVDSLNYWTSISLWIIYYIETPPYIACKTHTHRFRPNADKTYSRNEPKQKKKDPKYVVEIKKQITWKNGFYGNHILIDFLFAFTYREAKHSTYFSCMSNWAWGMTYIIDNIVICTSIEWIISRFRWTMWKRKAFYFIQF